MNGGIWRSSTRQLADQLLDLDDDELSGHQRLESHEDIQDALVDAALRVIAGITLD
jgi:hypothetical protein